MNVTLVLVLVGLGYVSFIFLAEAVNPFRNHIVRELQRRVQLGRQVGLTIAASSLGSVLFASENLLSQVTSCLLLVSPLLLVLLGNFFIVQRLMVSKRLRSSDSDVFGSNGGDDSSDDGDTEEYEDEPQHVPGQGAGSEVNPGRPLQQPRRAMNDVIAGPPRKIIGIDAETGKALEVLSFDSDYVDSNFSDEIEISKRK